MSGNTTPLCEQLVIVLAGPPDMACAWWILSRGWAKTVQRGTATEKTRHLQRVGFWALMAVMYTVTLGMTLYAWLKR
jgi:hypothetical protein